MFALWMGSIPILTELYAVSFFLDETSRLTSRHRDRPTITTFLNNYCYNFAFFQTLLMVISNGLDGLFAGEVVGGAAVVGLVETSALVVGRHP